MIGSLSQLIRSAAVSAIQDGSEQITKATLEGIRLDHAAEDIHRTTVRRRRPTQASLRRAQRLMPTRLRLVRGPLRSLPIPVRPLPGEFVRCYVARLAQANHVRPSELNKELRGPDRLDRLATLSGQPAESLRYALPEFGPGQGITHHWQPRPDELLVCPRCLAIRGVTVHVEVFSPFYQHVCLRHRQWMRTVTGRARPRVAACPEILHAQRRQHRLVRRHGHDVLWAAWNAVAEIIDAWLHTPDGLSDLHTRWDQRLTLVGETRDQVRFGEPMLQAATYPETVELTALLLDTRWRSLRASSTSPELFMAARRILTTRTAYALNPALPDSPEFIDELVHWFNQTHVPHPPPDKLLHGTA